VQEFLAASALVTRVEGGWDEALGKPDVNKKGFQAVSNYIDRMSWDLAWRPVLLFFVGIIAQRIVEISNPTTPRTPGDTSDTLKHHFWMTVLNDHLELLGKEVRDSVFHERLELALQCFVEIEEHLPSPK
ncbi:MAG: hypothetical protein ABL994_21205, partial [Verrucomicrobiales bacterium]